MKPLIQAVRISAKLCMSRYVKILVCAVCLGLGLRTASGFALLKPILPVDNWMTAGERL